jgi:hypothetical protein
MENKKFFDEEVEIAVENIKKNQNNVESNIEIYYVDTVITYINRRIDLKATISLDTNKNTAKCTVCTALTKIAQVSISPLAFSYFMLDLMTVKANPDKMYVLQLIYFNNKEINTTDTELILLSREEFIKSLILDKGLLDEQIENSLTKLRNKYIPTVVDYINVIDIQDDFDANELKYIRKANSEKIPVYEMNIPSKTIIKAETYYLDTVIGITAEFNHEFKNIIDITAEFDYSFKNPEDKKELESDEQWQYGYRSIECKCKCVAIREKDRKRIELTDRMEIVARDFDMDNSSTRNTLAVNLLKHTRIFDDLITRMRAELKGN